MLIVSSFSWKIRSDISFWRWEESSDQHTLPLSLLWLGLLWRSHDSSRIWVCIPTPIHTRHHEHGIPPLWLFHMHRDYSVWMQLWECFGDLCVDEKKNALATTVATPVYRWWVLIICSYFPRVKIKNFIPPDFCEATPFCCLLCSFILALFSFIQNSEPFFKNIHILKKVPRQRPQIIYLNFICSFIHVFILTVFIDACGLSLVAGCRHCSGFSWCRARTLELGLSSSVPQA